jgi:hypothetical protein
MSVVCVCFVAIASLVVKLSPGYLHRLIIPDDVLIQSLSDDEHCAARNMWRGEINEYIKKVRRVGY